MTCWKMFIKDVRRMLKGRITDEEAKEILMDIEDEKGHDITAIKIVIDKEKEKLAERLKKKEKQAERLKKKEKGKLLSYA